MLYVGKQEVMYNGQLYRARNAKIGIAPSPGRPSQWELISPSMTKREPVLPPRPGFANDYRSNKVYRFGDIVDYGTRRYKSIRSDNWNHHPVYDRDYWMPLSPSVRP